MTSILLFRHAWRSFSTHILTRRMTLTGSYLLTVLPFQLTSSQGGWPLVEHYLLTMGFFQLTSSQGGWRHVFVCYVLRFVFSTHILTRRMTSRNITTISQLFFQLTSSQGGWRYVRPGFLSDLLFNSHPHKEDDTSLLSYYIFMYFSTHILTRRMTI